MSSNVSDRSRWFWVLAASAALGCGDDDGGGGGAGGGNGGECGSSFSACGGDIVGTWTYTDACVDAPITSIPGSGGESPFNSCAQKPAIVLSLDVTGTANFGADGTFSMNQMSTSSLKVTVPESCVEAAGMGASCEDLGGRAAAKSCILEEEPETTSNTSAGTYAVSGTKLNIVSTGSSASNENVDFCVKGNTLTVRIDTGEGTRVYYTATRR